MKCLKPFFLSKQKILVGCGKCTLCRIQKRNIWTGRMILEGMYYEDKMFVTLTYDDKFLPDPPFISKKETQLFLKRLRKGAQKQGITDIKYYLCGEYGEKYCRPHYHAIIYGLSYKNQNHLKLVEQAWGKGFVQFEPAEINCIRYVAGYVTKKLSDGLSIMDKFFENYPREFQLMSRKPALGSRALEKFRHYIFSQDPDRIDVLHCFNVGDKLFFFDRTLRNKMREMVYSQEEVQCVKDIKLKQLQDEFAAMIGGDVSSLDNLAYTHAIKGAYYEVNPEVEALERRFRKRTKKRIGV